ncbi:hypothetical protein [Bradyrhizobium sp. WSM471]|uniref:hypothetical protein n=1 Tax=Bradyrhizobium sp. WSM471 TaxID=319017 RepID=UPI0002DCE141|nr:MULTISPECIES: hypothetical protein [Bradyrhizobium]UFW45166.1 hypothetical protein BcanWSM471_10420 [Bradyrhizobium canariense]
MAGDTGCSHNKCSLSADKRAGSPRQWLTIRSLYRRVVDATVPVAVAGHQRKTARRKAKPDVRAPRGDAGGIEIEAEGVTIRVGRGADVAMIAAIVHALKASR